MFFIIKKSVDKYLRTKRDSLFWCFVDFEKTFDPINREALWFKMRKVGVSGNVVNCIKIIYQGISFCVECGEDQISSCAPQTKGAH
jgi:Reverse transcriptase (RNA-dependent DNA polymerase).